jgi:hypothetical protein
MRPYHCGPSRSICASNCLLWVSLLQPGMKSASWAAIKGKCACSVFSDKDDAKSRQLPDRNRWQSHTCNKYFCHSVRLFTSAIKNLPDPNDSKSMDVRCDDLWPGTTLHMAFLLL